MNDVTTRHWLAPGAYSTFEKYRKEIPRVMFIQLILQEFQH